MLQFLGSHLEMRPSSIAPNPAESREAPPNPQRPSPLRGTLGSCLRSPAEGVVMLEKTLERLLDCKEFKPVNPKGNQSEYSLKELTDFEAEALILWPPGAKSPLIGKDHDAV